MRCPFCGVEFDAEAARKECRNCSMLGGCKKVKCPKCGYESPAETGLVKFIRKWRQRRHDRSAR